METMRRTVIEISQTPNLTSLSLPKLTLIPLLALSSSIYALSISIRRFLYFTNIFQTHRLPVKVISVGNLTWGGNGKTPMVEFLARWLDASWISPLVLSRGYAGGDEVKMLWRHLRGTSAKIGVGADRVMTAHRSLDRYGHLDPCCSFWADNLLTNEKVDNHSDDGRIGVAILDDGMQILCIKGLY
ncbi:hypothetical protein Droror1_Dr00014790 [Drosera rotundifolia]